MSVIVLPPALPLCYGRLIRTVVRGCGPVIRHCSSEINSTQGQEVPGYVLRPYEETTGCSSDQSRREWLETSKKFLKHLRVCPPNELQDKYIPLRRSKSKSDAQRVSMKGNKMVRNVE